MTRLNGVHALVAFLTQQAQSTQQLGAGKIDLKQLEALLHEARVLNERLLKIERQLSIAKLQGDDSATSDDRRIRDLEGQWPAASVVRDVINTQERQHAFGYQHSERSDTVEREAFSYKEVFDEQKEPTNPTQQHVTHRYTVSGSELLNSNLGINFGRGRSTSEHFDAEEDRPDKDSVRLLLVSIGFALLLFFVFALTG
jgi:hypothetical protein